MEQRIYHGKIDPNILADHLVGVFNQHVNQGMYYNHHHTMAQRIGEGDKVLVQIMRAGSWSKNGGTLGVSIARIPGGVSVDLGQSNWLDIDESTLAGMVVGALFFPPLLLLPLLSGLMRSTFEQDVWDVIDGYCAWVAARPESSSAPRFFRCPYCGAYNQPDAAQCSSCSGPFNYQPPQPPRRSSSAQVQPEPSVSESQSQTEAEPLASDPVSVQEPEPESIVCPACGTTVAAANFCGNCAAPLRDR